MYAFSQVSPFCYPSKLKLTGKKLRLKSIFYLILTILFQRKHYLGVSFNYTTQNAVRETRPVGGNSGLNGNAPAASVLGAPSTSASESRNSGNRPVGPGSGSLELGNCSSNSSFHSASPIEQMNQENERFSILAQMQLENLRRFDRIFLVPVLVWTIACSFKLVGLLEYIFFRAHFAPWSKVNVRLKFLHIYFIF